MISIKNFALLLILTVIAGVSFSSSFADTEVTIPLGASHSENPYSLSPAVLNVGVNETVTWQNNDNAIHTVTTGKPQLGYDGRIDSGIIQPGKEFSYQFTKEGVYAYYCLFHPWMTGLVNVGTDTTKANPTVQISISTDKASYNNADTIQVSGQVSKFIPNEQVTVWITDDQGKGITMSHVETDSNSFSTNIPIHGALWIPGNDYKVFAQYGTRSSVALATITYEPQLSVSSNTNSQSNVTISANTQNSVLYPHEHKKLAASSNQYITVQEQNNLYTPNQTVQIDGTIWDGVYQQLGGAKFLVTAALGSSDSVTELVNVQIKDPNGKLVYNNKVQSDATGNYHASYTVPEGSVSGTYGIETAIETKQGLLETLDTSISSKMNSSSSFTVTSPSEFTVKTQTGDLDVQLNSNSTISNFEFNSNAKKISFDVQGQSGTKGVTTITIPKTLLNGNLQVFIDGDLQSYNSDNIIATETSSDVTLELNYHHSTHTIDIVGTQAAQDYQSSTQAVPEFSSIAPLVLVVSVIPIVIFTRSKLHL